MEGSRLKLIIIAGPTASGKSSLAVDLANELSGEIVNADSMQVYRYMNIGTAKPQNEERMTVPHHLYDVVDPDEEFNASIYRSYAEPVIREVNKRDRLCFLVGGTGLYIKTLLGGLLECPPSKPELREELNLQYNEQGPEVLYKRLEKLDPIAAQNIHPNDRTRVVRSLEIIELTNKPVSRLVQKHDFQDNPYRSLKICLDVDREVLYKRINKRSSTMVDRGLIEETKKLLNMGYSPELKSMKSIGYRHAVSMIEGTWDRDIMIQQLQTDTRRYAKRQLTWFRGDPEMIWIGPDNRELIKKKINQFIAKLGF